MTKRGRSLSPAEREFFETFFERLRSAGLVAIILRNYQGFPAEMGNDLDVFFRRRDLDAATALFTRLLREFGGELLQIHERDYVLAVWFRVHASEAAAIHMDFYHGAYTWHGLHYLSEDDLVSACRPFNQFQIPRPAHEAMSLFLPSILWGGFFKPRYLESLRALLTDPAELREFERQFREQFGPAGEPPFNLLKDHPPSDDAILRYARGLRRRLKLRWLSRRPFVTTARLVRYWVGEFATVLRPPGAHIALMGPDGAGKSTALAALKQRVGYFFGETWDRHWRPGVLPDIGVALGRRVKTTGPVTDPHGSSAHSPLVSAARLVYYWLDYWLGYPFRIRKVKARNHLLLYDRYVQDLCCDPKRYRLGLPIWLIKPLCHCVPQPDLVFVLVGDAATIQQRKQELPLDTVKILLDRYREVARQDGRFHAIDCCRPVEQVADEMAGYVLAFLKAKAARHPLFQ